MRPSNTQVMAHVGESEVDFRMGIDQAAMAHIMNVLTDLYSDPMLAVIREYSTNGIDSNIEAGNLDPILVTLPTALAPQFMIQDHGLGLSIDEIRDVYAMYGNSTKRESNLVTGMLGLGCKSGLTYALQFTVNTVKNGLRTVATVTKDDKGVGTIKVLETQPTDARNGVTITIPVKSADVLAFREKADNFYQYWKPGTVLVDGSEPTSLYDDSAADTSVWIGRDIRITKATGRTNSVVVMGNVPYPFDMSSPGASYGDRFPHQVIAWVEMASLDFTPSREALMDTDHTLATLSRLRTKIRENFHEALKDKVAAEASNWESLKVWQTWRWDLNPARGTTAEERNKGNIELPPDSSVWQYDDYNEKASRIKEWLTYHTIQDESRTIITGYERRSLIPSARFRLKQILAKQKAEGYGKTLFLIPEGVDLDIIDGRPNIITWQDVLDTTDEPPAAVKGAAVKKEDVLYTVVTNGVMTQSSGKVVAPGQKIVYAPVQQVPYDDDENRWNRRIGLQKRSKAYPEAVFVSISEGQIEKFKRLHPGTVDFDSYVKSEAAAAVKALTEADKQIHHINQETPTSNLIDALRTHGKTVKRSIIRKVVALEPSPAVDRCVTLNVAIPEPKKDLNRTILEAYPLIGAACNDYTDLDGAALDDLIWYIDTKRQSRSSNQ